MEKELLGYRNYKPQLGQLEFYADDLKNTHILQKFLNEVDTMESDITPAGKAFLLNSENVNLVESLEKAGGLIENGYVKKEDILKWLNRVDTNEMAKFLSQVSGQKKTG